jgi:hypothetical protein
MALLITCSFCPGEYVLVETAPPPRDMRACDCTRMPPLCACECTRMLRTDHVFLLSRRLRSLRNRAAAARSRNLPEAPKTPRMRPCRHCRERRRWCSGAACPCRRWWGCRCLNEYIAMQTPVPARSCMQFEPPEPRSKSNRMNFAYNVVCDVVCDVVCMNIRYAGQNIRCRIR